MNAFKRAAFGLTLWLTLVYPTLVYSGWVHSNLALSAPLLAESSLERQPETVSTAANQADALITPANPSDRLKDLYRFKDLVDKGDGFMANTSTDGFLVMGNLDLPRSQACNLLLDIEFKQPMFRPGLFEVFWAVDPSAFSESQKARFLINHQDSAKPETTFVIPLCKLYTFSGNLSVPHHQRNIVGVRLDYPMNRDIAIKFKRMALMSNAELSEWRTRNDAPIIELEPYERLSGTAFRSLDVVIPKLYFGFEDGATRLTQDWAFLGVWLLMIAVFMSLIVLSFFHKKNR